MIGVDTNVLLRWIASDVVGTDDARHQSLIIEDMIADGREPIFVNHVVLAEAVWVLRRRAGVSKQTLIEVINVILNSTNVVVDDRDTVVAAFSDYGRQRGDFPDQLIGQINVTKGCRTTMTFDKTAAQSSNFSELTR
ncbi:MAG: PIN domain-containing protein [Neorhizobium sp.]|nr:PIN domain-containing protein [Neorhizobium sp.]